MQETYKDTKALYISRNIILLFVKNSLPSYRFK